MNEWCLLQILLAYKDKFLRNAVAIDFGATSGQWSVLLTNYFQCVSVFNPNPNLCALLPSVKNVQFFEATKYRASGGFILYRPLQSEQNLHAQVQAVIAPAHAHHSLVNDLTSKEKTIDESFPSGVDFFKINNKGAEVEVLAACSTDGRWDRTFFLVECHDAYPEIDSLLVGLGKQVLQVPDPFQGDHSSHCWVLGIPPNIEPVDLTFDFQTKELVAADLVRCIRRDVNGKCSSGYYDGIPIIAHAEGHNLKYIAESSELFPYFLNCLNISAEIHCDFETEQLQLGVKGYLLSRLKGVIWKLLNFYTLRMWNQQKKVNTLLLSALKSTHQQSELNIVALEARIAALEDRNYQAE